MPWVGLICKSDLITHNILAGLSGLHQIKVSLSFFI